MTLAGRRNSWASGSPASWTLAKEPKVPARRYLERLLTFPGTGIWGGKAPAGLSRDRLRCAGRTFLQRPVSCAKGRWRPCLFPGSQELCEPGGNDWHHLTAHPPPRAGASGQWHWAESGRNPLGVSEPRPEFSPAGCLFHFLIFSPPTALLRHIFTPSAQLPLPKRERPLLGGRGKRQPPPCRAATRAAVAPPPLQRLSSLAASSTAGAQARASAAQEAW